MHIAALSYALADFCRLGVVSDFLTCTDKLQQWNQPRGRRVDPIPVTQLGARCCELLPTKKQSSGAQSIFDPRLLSMREADQAALEQLRCDLLNLGQPSGFLSVIVLCVKKVEHDHCYCSPEQQESRTLDIDPSSTPLTSDLELSSYFNAVVVTECSILNELCLTSQQRDDLEKETRSQANNAQWHESRRCRITGSKCERILQQNEKTAALLRSCIFYPKPMLNHFPKAIAWGRRNEEKACLAYVKHMHMRGHPGLQTSPSGPPRKRLVGCLTRCMGHRSFLQP